MIKEKDVELQHLANTLKNLQRTKQDLEDNLNRALREKDSIISQLQLLLQGKTNDMEVSLGISYLYIPNISWLHKYFLLCGVVSKPFFYCLQEMSQAMLSQSQSQARDLAEKMGQRLKVTEAMLAEATKARENLVTDNESAVEGLLATISSKDKLLKVGSTTNSFHCSSFSFLFWSFIGISFSKLADPLIQSKAENDQRILFNF